MKVYGLYDLNDYETCVYVGTIKEVSDFLNIKPSSIHCHITRKRKGIINLLKHKYDLVEIKNTDREAKDEV